MVVSLRLTGEFEMMVSTETNSLIDEWSLVKPSHPTRYRNDWSQPDQNIKDIRMGGLKKANEINKIYY